MAPNEDVRPMSPERIPDDVATKRAAYAAGSGIELALMRLRRGFASPLRAIFFGIAISGVALLIRLALNDDEPRFVMLYPAVAIAALLAGPWAGLVATLVASVAVDYFLFEPRGSLSLTGAGDVWSLINFVLTGLVIAAIAGVDRSMAARMIAAARVSDAKDAQHRTIVSTLHEGVVVFSADGRVLSANPSAERITRRTAAQIAAEHDGFVGWDIVRDDGEPFERSELPAAAALRTGQPRHDEVIGLRIDGEIVWLLANADPIRDSETGTTTAVVVSITDITERRRVERELAESRARLASTFAALREGILVFSPAGALISWNPSAERILGLSTAEMAARGPVFLERRILRETGDAMPIDDYPAVRALRHGESCHDAVIGVPVGDRHAWVLANAEPIRDAATGAITAAVVSIHDITERRRVERELAESRARYEAIVATAMDAIITVDGDQRIVLFNAAAERMFGCPASDVLGTSIERFVPERARARHRAGFAAFVASGEPTHEMGGRNLELTACRVDGAEFPIEASISRMIEGDRALYTVVHRDISERLEADRANARLATVVKSSPSAILTVGVDGIILTWNAGATALFGYTASEAIGRPIAFLSFPGQPDHGEGIRQRIAHGESVEVETYRRRADGTRVEVLSIAAPIRDAAGRVVAGAAILTDITERKRTERLLRERADELRQTLDAAGLGVWWIEVSNGDLHCDQRSRVLFDTDEVGPVALAADRFRGDDRQRFLRLGEALASAPVGRPLVLQAIGIDGSPRWLALTARLRRTDHGHPEVWGTVQDVTEQRTAERAMKQIEASRRLEALGRMTGGIAHDFNNLLTVISGNLQLLEMVIDDPAAARYVAEALRAAESGADLNHRLITFARQRRLEPVITDLGEQIGRMIDLVHRSVGPRITVVANLARDLWPVRVDPSEIENAVLNLAFNARDAMPDGGRLLIETRNMVIDEAALPIEEGVGPGAYARLTVSDTGTGMSADVKARAFEPFFTTKAHGRGTGLGLASLHGFVRQSGGFVTLYSEIDRGTTVNVYLPRAVSAEAGARPSPPPAPKVVRGHGETILVVEDNPDVSRVTCERLAALGYTVRPVENATAALAALADGGSIDLVFSDIVMPGELSGIELARRLRAADPSRRIVLTSGFAEEIVRGEGRPPLEFPVLRKPYALAELADAIADALGAGPTEISPG